MPTNGRRVTCSCGTTAAFNTDAATSRPRTAACSDGLPSNGIGAPPPRWPICKERAYPAGSSGPPPAGTQSIEPFVNEALAGFDCAAGGEIAVVAAGDPHDPLGRRDQRIEPLAG